MPRVEVKSVEGRELVTYQCSVCLRCGHPACEYCGKWCDTFVGDDHEMCCDGECTYEEKESVEETGRRPLNDIERAAERRRRS